MVQLLDGHKDYYVSFGRYYIRFTYIETIIFIDYKSLIILIKKSNLDTEFHIQKAKRQLFLYKVCSL